MIGDSGRQGRRAPRSASIGLDARTLGVAVIAALLPLTACSSSDQPKPIGPIELENIIRSGGVQPTRIVVPYRLNSEMKRWLGENVEESITVAEDKLFYLSEALFDPNGFHVDYVRGYTGTASEVFRTRQANCLAFTHMFIGMARHLGVPAFFLEVRNVENYRREGDLIVVSDHVAVGFGPVHDLRVIDFAATDENAEYLRIRVIDDRRAIAMYYSNRGAEELRRGEYEESLGWLRSAVAIDPAYDASWVNLGVALRRWGDLESAELAYRTALEIDLHSTSALQNLAALLSQKGEGDEAMELLALADRSSNRNPYTYLTLGDLSMRHGKQAAAGRFYRKALGRGENAESLAAMGLWHLTRGEQKKATSWLRRASDLDPQSSRVSLLKRRLEQAQNSS